jgi:spermidine synthase
MLAGAVCLATPSIAAERGERVVHREVSAFQTLVVTDSATRRCLRFGDAPDALNQSCRLHRAPLHLAFDYTRAMTAALLLWQPAPQRVLLIGVGGGSIPTALAAVRPAMQIDAVDIDPAVLAVAQRHFGLAPGPRLRLHAADGRAFVAAARARGDRFDAVLLDAFDEEGIPPALFDDAFLRDVAALLGPGGVFLANTFAASAGYAQESARAEAVFGRFLNLRLRTPGTRGGNRLLIAAADPARLPTPQQLLAAWPQQRATLARLGIDDAFRARLRFAGRDWVAAPARSDDQPDQRGGQAGGQQAGQH